MAIRVRFWLPDAGGVPVGCSVEYLKSQLFWTGSGWGSNDKAAILPTTALAAPHVGVYVAAVDTSASNLWQAGHYLFYFHRLDTKEIVGVSGEAQLFRGADYPATLQPKDLVLTFDPAVAGKPQTVRGSYY